VPMTTFNSASEKKRRLRSRAKIHRWTMRTAASTLAYRRREQLQRRIVEAHSLGFRKFSEQMRAGPL
jgi:hypothetical protein